VSPARKISLKDWSAGPNFQLEVFQRGLNKGILWAVGVGKLQKNTYCCDALFPKWVGKAESIVLDWNVSRARGKFLWTPSRGRRV